MSDVARICESTQRHGNALVLLLLLKTWDAAEPPTRDELAKLAHISPRQAERDLLKLVEDGEVEKVGRRGQVTRFQIKGLTHMSDESDNALTNMTDEVRTDVSDPAPAQSDMSVESAISDIPLSVPSDTSVRPFDGTEVAPLSAETISSNTSQPPPTASVDAGATAPRRSKPRPSELDKLSEPERLVIKAWHELTRHYPKLSVWPYILGRLTRDFDAERFARCGGAYLANFGMGQQHVAGICDWYGRNQTERNARDGPPGKASNVERSMDAVRSFIAKEQAGNVR